MAEDVLIFSSDTKYRKTASEYIIADNIDKITTSMLGDMFPPVITSEIGNIAKPAIKVEKTIIASRDDSL